MTPDEARAIAAPDSWPWPMSEDAKRWVQFVTDIDEKIYEIVGDFNHEEHERFMRGLG